MSEKISKCETKEIGTYLVTLTTWEDAGGEIIISDSRDGDIGEVVPDVIPFMYAGNAEDRFYCLENSEDVSRITCEFYGITDEMITDIIEEFKDYI
jgi:hypothetical protein